MIMRLYLKNQKQWKNKVMTQEEKVLLLKDLSGRLSYGIKCKVNYIINNETTYGEDVESECIDIIKRISFDTYSVYTEWLGYESDIEDIKPYLRPMSSMTEEEIDMMWNISENDAEAEGSSKITDLLNKWNLDHHHLIERGLAIAVTEENNPYKE